MSREIKENEMKWGTMPLKRWARKRKSVSGKWRSGRNRGKRTECIHKEIKEENISKMFLVPTPHLQWSFVLFHLSYTSHDLTLDLIHHEEVSVTTQMSSTRLVPTAPLLPTPSRVCSMWHVNKSPTSLRHPIHCPYFSFHLLSPLKVSALLTSLTSPVHPQEETSIPASSLSSAPGQTSSLVKLNHKPWVQVSQSPWRNMTKPSWQLTTNFYISTFFGSRVTWTNCKKGFGRQPGKSEHEVGTRITTNSAINNHVIVVQSLPHLEIHTLVLMRYLEFALKYLKDRSGKVKNKGYKLAKCWKWLVLVHEYIRVHYTILYTFMKVWKISN